MGFFDITPKKESTQICVEVFKGHLEKDAIVDYTKKEFTDNENLIESVFIVEGADENLMTIAKKHIAEEVVAGNLLGLKEGTYQLEKVEAKTDAVARVLEVCDFNGQPSYYIEFIK